MAGLVGEKRVNESCRRVLSQKFAAGLFDDPNAGVAADNATLAALLDTPSRRRLARSWGALYFGLHCDLQ